jgi:NitT/TauT family transport system ATP-binding protein
MSAASAAKINSGVPITIRNVSKVFGEDTDTPFQALKPINAAIAAGEFISVVGASGCGKSTLMLMVAGLLKQTTGEIRVGNTVVAQPITDVGIAFQDHLLLDFRTAFENVMLHADIRRLPRPTIERRAKELFAQLRLDHAMHKYPIQLSGGMRQRVSLIRTLVHDPSVILMDEPFGALDALTRLQVRSDLEALWLRRRPTVLFITHSVEEAVGLSDRVLVMSPSPGMVVDEIAVDLPRPRPLVLGDAPEFGAYVNRIHHHFERLGVLHGAVGALPPNCRYDALSNNQASCRWIA